DVLKCIRMLTFLPLDQIKEMESWQGAELNKAKEILAYELTSLVHGKEEADIAQQSAKALFAGGGDDSNMPTTALNFEGDEILLIDVLVETKLCASRGEAKKLIQQGGVSVEEEKVNDLGYKFTRDALKNGIKIKKGKKIYHKITV
ncbi:tyrosine--tRNA ligase, partial [bacterium]|nr:tyrosine--tRNA ligase [bacterium]